MGFSALGFVAFRFPHRGVAFQGGNKQGFGFQAYRAPAPGFQCFRVWVHVRLDVSNAWREREREVGSCGALRLPA